MLVYCTNCGVQKTTANRFDSPLGTWIPIYQNNADMAKQVCSVACLEKFLTEYFKHLSS